MSGPPLTQTSGEPSCCHTLPMILLTALILLCSASPAFSQGLPQTDPARVGLSAERLGNVDRFIGDIVDNNRIAGAVALIARHGRTAHFETYGMMDIGNGIPMREDAIFRIASMSKPITCTAAMILYEEGRFLLTDPVADYIPAFGDMEVIVSTGGAGEGEYETVPAERPVTIRHLLNHTSGISYGDGVHSDMYAEADIRSIYQREGATIGDMVEVLATLPLAHQPGEEFTYSLSQDVIGHLVEIVSGQPLDEFVQERICIPLGMKDTNFYVPDEKMDRLATLYRPAGDGLEPVDRGSGFGSRTYFSGGGGMYSTASDYVRFCQMILNGGELDGVRILGRKTVELMTTNSIGDELYSAFRTNSGDKYGYGFGIRTERGEYDEVESIGTIMWDGAYHTRFWIDPSEDFIGIFMSQLQPRDWRLPGMFRVTAYQAIID